MKRILQGFCVLAGLAGLAFGFAPALFGVFNAGCIALAAYGGLLCLTALLWDAFRAGTGFRIERSFRAAWDRRAPEAARPPRWWRRTRAVLAAVLLAGFAAGAALSAPMARQAWFNPPGEGARTVVVLGCQVDRSGRPSLMLARRLDAAYDYLAAHPEAPVVVSGGYEKTAGTSEAAVMAEYLAARGIGPERIRLEDRSHSTEENIAYTAEIIGREGLPRALAVATDGFHQYRAALYAGKNGLTAESLPSGTPWGLFPSYWVREMLGIAKAAVM